MGLGSAPGLASLRAKPIRVVSTSHLTQALNRAISKEAGSLGLAAVDGLVGQKHAHEH